MLSWDKMKPLKKVSSNESKMQWWYQDNANYFYTKDYDLKKQTSKVKPNL